MKNALFYNVLFAGFFSCCCSSVTAQYSTRDNAAETLQATNKRMENYQYLRSQGYQDKEIFEDLGNANFLNKNYDTALFWYDKLKEVSKSGSLSKNYQKRYDYALAKYHNIGSATSSDNNDWVAQIASDYKVKSKTSKNILDQPLTERYRELDFQRKDGKFIVDDQTIVENELRAFLGDGNVDHNGYKMPVAVSPDGKTAYFSKKVMVKPLYGLFSKEEEVHKIFKAEKVRGKWKNIQEVAVAPKHASAMHPSISSDGKRLFFASNMPGTFGEYDIYVSAIRKDGSMGVAKNLGQKVNTKKDDLYPNVVGTNTLFFASEGRKGQGGLDVYMTQVGQKHVGLAVNLGSPINSSEDDFAISFTSENGKGYVMSNRGNRNAEVQKVAFTYANKRPTEDNSDYRTLEAFNTDSELRFTSNLFEED
ncbi:WD40-like Beta Propeller Repeat [Zobellia uliginosa]|uniref:WD40-like Beta Propeller Repeat n=1 Tax=Zobellia uliginosa TaxID=143224 RepID=A0ABY1KR70_9FLAO|nr:PD40 domain-containing protein [Zobellia uliginosa]SIS67942.1 WD40-like Beta Propeller Repeat [Zobellia uliginosa]